MSSDGALQVRHFSAEASQLFQNNLTEIVSRHEVHPLPAKAHEATAVATQSHAFGLRIHWAHALPAKALFNHLHLGQNRKNLFAKQRQLLSLKIGCTPKIRRF